MLNPVFSIEQMRGLTPIFYKVAQKVDLRKLFHTSNQLSQLCVLTVRRTGSPSR